MVIQFEGDARKKIWRNIPEERAKLKKDPQFQAGVSELYEKILSQNPELSVAVDEIKQYNKKIQKNWKEKNKVRLKEYRDKLNLTYRQNRKCQCGKVITDKANKCRTCFLKTLKHGERRHEDRRAEDNEIPIKKTGSGSEQTGVQEAVSRLPSGDSSTVQDVPVLPKSEEEQK